jgi:serine/threonine-protein kinase
MGEVFLALQKGPGGFERRIALKFMLPEHAEDPEFIQRFLDEGRIAATLSHPNICQVIELGIEEGRHFIAMEFLDGRSLGRVRKRASQTKAPVSPAWYAYAVARAAEGLAYAHEKRGTDGKPLLCVHRDVSPENIVVTFEGRVKVVDFGMARAAERVSRTKTGFVGGKIAYMAPERVLNHDVDARLDVFGLGVTLYELLTDRPLYGSLSDLDILRGVAAGTLPRFDWSLVPKELAPVVEAAAHPSLEQRLPSASALQRQLDAVVAQLDPRMGPERLAEEMKGLFADASSASPVPGDPTKGLRAPTKRIQGRPDTPHRSAKALGAVGVVALAAALGLGLWRARRASVPSPLPATVAAARASAAPTPAPTPAPVAAAKQPVSLNTVAPAEVPKTPSLREPETTHTRSHVHPAALPKQARSQPPHTPMADTAPGRLTVDSSPWAEVYLGNQKLGTTPLFELTLPAGHHRLRLVNPAMKVDRMVDVDVEAGKTTAQRFSW